MTKTPWLTQQPRVDADRFYCKLGERTRSSAVAVIADRTAHDVRYRPTGKLSNWFRLQVYKRLVRTIQFNG